MPSDRRLSDDFSLPLAFQLFFSLKCCRNVVLLGHLTKMANRLTFALYAVGVVFLILAARSWYSATKEPEVQGQFLAVDESFDFDALKSSDGFNSYGPATDRKPGDLLAVFTMPVDPCVDCANEVHAFRAMLNQRGLSGRPVKAEIVVVGEQSVAAKRFAKTTDFEQEIWFGSDKALDRSLVATIHIIDCCA